MKANLKTLAIVVGLACGIASAQAATTIRIGHDSQESSPAHQAMLHFEQELETKSGGDLKVEIYPARQLGGVQETTELVQQGNLQMTFGASVLLAPYVPEFNVLDSFYLFKNIEQAHKALDNANIGGKLLTAMETKGFKGLGFMELGFRSVTNNVRPIVTMDDFDNLKIRAASNPTQLSAWKSVGTLPIPLSWGEVFTSLQQGLINAQESSIYSIYAERFYEAQKYLTLTEHIYTNYVFFSNKDFWDGLTSDERQLIHEVVASTITLQRELSAKQNKEVIEELEAKGMQVNTAPNELRSQMEKRMNAAVYDNLREKTGPTLFDEIMMEIEKI